MRQSDEMIESFSHILQHLLIEIGASSSRGHFGGTSPFMVQVNFDIPVFEGKIDARSLFLCSQFFGQRKDHLRTT
jgi:hypothetical protein